jgi:Spy/CpxP family protein refolding chaperone
MGIFFRLLFVATSLVAALVAIASTTAQAAPLKYGVDCGGSALSVGWNNDPHGGGLMQAGTRCAATGAIEVLRINARLSKSGEEI